LNRHGEEARERRLRTMLRIAGRTMKASVSPAAILRDARQGALLRMRLQDAAAEP
jgi:hypothetical protein